LPVGQSLPARRARRDRLLFSAVHFVFTLVAAIGAFDGEPSPYLAENVSATTKMMIDMGIRLSGDVDADFVAMMVPHHQGAIEMAQAELRYGRKEPLRRMAQELSSPSCKRSLRCGCRWANHCRRRYRRLIKPRPRQ
jgi:Domain of unknown function (DUF305)